MRHAITVAQGRHADWYYKTTNGIMHMQFKQDMIPYSMSIHRYGNNDIDSPNQNSVCYDLQWNCLSFNKDSWAENSQ